MSVCVGGGAEAAAAGAGGGVRAPARHAHWHASRVAADQDDTADTDTSALLPKFASSMVRISERPAGRDVILLLNRFSS